MTRNLRERARERLCENALADTGHMTPEDVQSLVEELRIHQFELEIQNEELGAIQHELAESRDRYRALYEHAPVGYLTLDDSGRISEINRAGGAVLGLDRARLLGTHLTDFVAPESEDTWARHQEGARTTGEQQVSELVLHNVSGRRWHVQVESHANSDRPEQLFCVLIDISDRKRAEFALEQTNADLERRVAERTAEIRANEARVQAIHETVPTGIITVDGRGRIESVNSAIERILGYVDGDQVGEGFGRLLTEPYASDYERFIRGEVEDDEGAYLATREIVAQCRDGTELPAEVAISYVPQLQLFVIALRDLSETKRLQNEVLDAAEAERFRISSELHDDVAQQLAALAMKAHALAGQAHQRDAPEADTLATFSTQLRAAVDGLRKAVHDLAPLDLEGGRLKIALERLARESSEHSGVECTFTATGSGARTDPREGMHLLRIAGEAIHNAVKHATPTRIHTELEEAEDQIRLTVHDDGCGLEHPATGHEGIGMRLMGYRASMIGARLEIQRGPDGGTAVTCTLARLHACTVNMHG